MAENQFNQAQDGSELRIVKIECFEPPGAADPSVVITKGQTFTIRVNLEYTELLGDVHAKTYIQLCVNEICSGSSQRAYEQSKTIELQKDSTQCTVDFGPINASVEGIFKIHMGAVVTESEIAAYMEGPILFVIVA